MYDGTDAEEEKDIRVRSSETATTGLDRGALEEGGNKDMCRKSILTRRKQPTRDLEIGARIGKREGRERAGCWIFEREVR